MLGDIIEGIGLLGPGLKGWGESGGGRNVLAGRVPYTSAPTDLPVPGALPPSERRRASRATKLVLAIGLEASAAAAADPATLATVFASSGGDG